MDIDMDHEDFIQTTVSTPEGEVYVTLCTCGKAFWDHESQAAYEMWEEHEAES